MRRDQLRTGFAIGEDKVLVARVNHRQRAQQFVKIDFGAAYAAGLAVGFFQDTDELVANWAVDQRWEPTMDETSRERLYHYWKKAVTRSFGWVES